MKKQIMISQCMIVKNEEDNIEQALSWGKDIVSEQIVVDTGSTDRTVELAQQLGAKVYHFSWIDDFSAAKNFAISKAECEWIALLDADEYFSKEDAGKLKLILSQLEDKPYDGLATKWIHLEDDKTIKMIDAQVRIFRNRPGLRYHRRIHEYLAWEDGTGISYWQDTEGLSLFHTGYQGQAFEQKKKSGRNRKLILEELKNNPEDYEMMGYMGDDCQSDGDKEEAVMWFRRAIEHMPSKLQDYDQRSAVTFTSLLMLLTDGEESLWREAEEVYHKAVKLLPQEADFDYIMGHFYAVRGEAEKAVFHLETAMEKLNKYGCNNKALHMAANLLDVYDLLVRCCHMTGQNEKCLTYGVTYLKYEKFNMAVLSLILKTLLPGGGNNSAQENQAVLGFLSKLYDFSSLKDRLFLVKAAQMSDCQIFGTYLSSVLFTSDERKQLGL